MDLLPGQESDGIRVLDFRRVGDADRGEWQLTTEGAGGKAYRLRLYGVPLSRADGARVTGVEGNATTIEIEMPDAATTRTTATIHLFAQR
jgi:hypothetical protein